MRLEMTTACPGERRLELLVTVGTDGDEGVLEDHGADVTGGRGPGPIGRWAAGASVDRKADTPRAGTVGRSRRA